jgi:hypothetical protein
VASRNGRATPVPTTCSVVERWCPGAELNHRHTDFQSAISPDYLFPKPACVASLSQDQQSAAYKRHFTGSELGVIILKAREEMAVPIKRHLD